MSRCYIFGNRKKCLPGVYSMIGRGIGIPFRHGTSGGGTSIPPEIKKSIVAWYSPYKQKLTNYDVIEAYIEDFTKWAYRDSRGTAKITNNTIVITNVVETNNIVEDDNKPYSDLTIRVTGVTENKYLIVRQGRGKPEAHIKKDGVYTFKDNNLYFGFGFGVSVIGECNITITQLPTSILKDFSGNKHDAYLYGFKGKLNSGVGIYAQDFKNWNYGSVINNNISTKSYNKFHIVKKKADNWFGFTIGIQKANYWGIPYLDLKGDLQVPMMLDGRYDNSIVNSKAIQLRNKAFQTSNDDHHPNPKCHLYRSTIIENFLRQL